MTSPNDLVTFQIDAAERPALVQTLARIGTDPERPVCLFRHVLEIFTVYGDDAEMIAAEFYLNKSFARSMTIPSDGDEESSDNSISYINISPGRIEKLLKLIIGVKRRAVELYGQPNQEWISLRKIYPGQLESINEFLFDTADESSEKSCVIMAISSKIVKQTQILGIAIFNPLIREFATVEFIDNQELSSVDALLIEHTPKECIIEGDMSTNKDTLTQLLSRRSIPFSFQPKTMFATNALEQDLKRLLAINVQQYLSDLENAVAMRSLAGLLRHCSLLENDSLNGKCSLTRLELHEYMKPLDNNASRALNLFPSMLDSNTDSSLFGVLNKCKTAAGSRLLQHWIKQPLMSISLINNRLDCVESLSADSHLNSTFRDAFLKRIPDLRRLSGKLQQGKATLADCVRLYQFTVNLPHGLSILSDIANTENCTPLIRDKFFKPLQQITADFQQFNKLIESTIDLDAVERHEFIVRAEFSEELRALKIEKDDLINKINILGTELDSQTGLGGKLKIESRDGLGYHFRVSRKEEKQLRGCSRLIYLETRKDGVRFTTLKLKDLSTSYSDIAKEYDRVQGEIASKCISVVVSYTPLIDQCDRILSQIDVLCAFAHVVNHSNGYVRPTLLPLGSRKLELIKSRHPCLELQPHIQSYISNDISMDPEHRFEIITGPNMGGKSTYLRQTAMIIIMAQIGCFVPCESATVSICDCILARVGASDSQLRGISTFYAEMLEASSMIRSATKNSFIIIDELGRGTSTSEGFGLAWAISDYICQRIQCLALFATHFHELTEITSSCPAIVNRHVTAHTTDNEITMLYEVQKGPCDRSFGIHVAEIAQFPPNVIKMAQEKARELESIHNTDREQEQKFFEAFQNLPIDTLSDQELFASCQAICESY